MLGERAFEGGCGEGWVDEQTWVTAVVRAGRVVGRVPTIVVA